MKLPEVFKRDYMSTVIIILAVILLVVIFWFGLRFVFRTEHPILAVASGSMEPVLYKGDLIFVQGIQNIDNIYVADKNADPPGDILVYQGSRDLIVHRAIDKEIVDGEYIFTFHGDANQLGANEYVNEDQIVGKYTGFKIPLLGYIPLLFSPLEVKIAFIALFIIALILLELYPLIKKRLRSQDTEASLYK